MRLEQRRMLPETDFQEKSPSQSLTKFMDPFKDDFLSLYKTMKDFLPSQSISSRNILEYLMQNTGKMLRPAIFFQFCNTFGYHKEHRIQMAAVIEYIHIASLLHDDVIDGSSLRRNKAAVHTIWGPQCAILVGDLIYARASEIMTLTENLEVVKTFAKAIRLMSEGELIQLENIFNYDMSLETYLQIINFKTGALLSAACKTSGLLAGFNQKECEALTTFGSYIGQAFQIVDDLLDYTSSQNIAGKTIQKDLIEGKITIPFIYLKKHLSHDLENKIKNSFKNKKVSLADTYELNRLFMELEIASNVLELAKTFTKKATDILKKYFSCGYDLSPFDFLCEKIIQRKY